MPGFLDALSDAWDQATMSEDEAAAREAELLEAQRQIKELGYELRDPETNALMMIDRDESGVPTIPIEKWVENWKQRNANYERATSQGANAQGSESGATQQSNQQGMMSDSTAEFAGKSNKLRAIREAQLEEQKKQ